MKYVDKVTNTLSKICGNTKCDVCPLRFEHNNAICIYNLLLLYGDKPSIILKRLYEDIEYYNEEEINEKD